MTPKFGPGDDQPQGGIIGRTYSARTPQEMENAGLPIRPTQKGDKP